MSIFLILLFGLVIRLISLNQSFWLDEGTTALVSQMPILTKFSPSDFHPPLFYMMIRGWSMVFGSSEVVLRLPSILFSLATIFLIYKLWQNLISKKDAWIPALFLATSGLFIYYSQEARMYMFSAFLATLAMFSFARLDSRSARQVEIGDWLIFAISITLLSFSDYLPNFIILVFWIIAWKKRSDKTWFKKFVASHIFLGLAWVWWFPFFIKQLGSGLKVSSNSPLWWEMLGKFSFKNVVLIPAKFIIGRVGIENNFIYTLVLSALLLAFGYLLFLSKKHYKKVKLIYLWLLLPLFLTIFLSFKLSVLSYFRLLFILPAFYILVALGTTTLKKTWKYIFLTFVLLVNLITSGFYLFSPRFHRENWREVSKLEGQVVFPSSSQQEAYLYYSKGVRPQTLITVDSKSDIIWSVRYVTEISDPNNLVGVKLQDLGYLKTGEQNFNGILVYRYEKIK